MTEQQNKLYEKAKQYAKKNVKGNCDELKCLAEMLYEFAEQETKLLSEHILELQKTNGSLTDRVNEAREIIKEYLKFTAYTQVSYDPLRKRAEQFLGDEK